MRIALYGGSFDPPHVGHIETARAVMHELKPDRLLIIPCLSVHGKDSGHLRNYANARLELCREAFNGIEGAEVSDMEISRGEPSYTADTVKSIRKACPDAELILVIGEDKLSGIRRWYEADYILSNCTVAVAQRECVGGDVSEYHDALLLSNRTVDASSELIKENLKNGYADGKLSDSVYSLIIKNKWYDAVPDLTWLRSKAYTYLKDSRKPHVAGCEKTALELAKLYGCDERMAVTAAILHDITKKMNHNEQLLLCSKYGIICDDVEKNNEKLLHSKTGAYFSKDLFGVEDDVFNAILWHTTGKPKMSLLEKIIYIADYIEPTRDFPGVDALRSAAYTDIDSAMLLGLKMSLEDLADNGISPHKNTCLAYEYYKEIINDRN